MFVDLRFRVMPQFLGTSQALKAAKEAQQQQVYVDRDRAYEQVSLGKFC